MSWYLRCQDMALFLCSTADSRYTKILLAHVGSGVSPDIHRLTVEGLTPKASAIWLFVFMPSFVQ